MKWVAACLSVVLFALPASAQYDGPAIGYGEVPPTAPDTLVWAPVRDRFTYVEDWSVWIGQAEEWPVGTNTDAYTGFLNFYDEAVPSFTKTDTTTGAEVGYTDTRLMRLIEVEMVPKTYDVDCTTQIWVDQTLAIKVAWDTSWTTSKPSADSSNGWVAPAERVVFAADAVISADQICNGGTVDSPFIVLWVAEEVTP